jgi:glucokinase
MNHTQRANSPTVTIGIDLGGTGTRLVALDDSGRIHGRRTALTPQRVAGDNLAVSELLQQIRAVAGDARIDAVGIGASGPIDDEGVIRNDNTLAAFSNVSLIDLISSEFGVPCVIDNATVTAAIGENTYGAGENARSLLMVILGAGVGVALLVDGKPVRAADGSHPEAGHLPVAGPFAPCYCGLPTCWEQVASRTALDHLTSGRTTEFAARAYDNDVVAETVFDVYGGRVAAGLAILLPLTRPTRLVLGGTAAQYLPLFSAVLDESLKRSPGFSYNPQRFPAALGARSGAIGAAVLARRAGRVPLPRTAGGVHV